ncbi:hypothetical protein ASC97_27715 [Rhizobium sp. Root1203]|uniref:sugar ABC transporter ATP-binding protein n=1 Tax=Rhizobium sp. Root1203 TaxID=1736427 RepID=UPI0007111046|nr:sugar ABC transporter ATP-binding protein [Rhizobium sp. Root1203]KQV22163.1 hypothetical protein ASC97_27715 [Rhizobium sp. Root1203]
MTEIVLQAQNVTKQFFGISVVVDVSLSVRAGETIAMLGENGAGKSTLMKLIAGVHPHSSFDGQIFLDGKELRLKTVREAEERGIVLVQQELHVAGNLSIAENAAMGRLPNRFGVVDRAQMLRHAMKCLQFFQIDADPTKPMATLSASEQRLLMIASALSKASPRLLILDEPTAALTPGEAEHLYNKIRQVTQSGVPTIFITHRLDEVEQVCDRALVMRNGKLVFETETIKNNRTEIVKAMIGREPELRAPRVVKTDGTCRLRVENLTVAEAAKSEKLNVDNASLTVAAGEIVGLFGLVGAGQTELAMAIYGSWKGPVSGRIVINGVEGRPTSPSEALRRRCAMLTEDRKWSGIFEGQSALRNVSAASVGAISKFGVISRTEEFRRNMKLANDLDLRPLDLRRNVELFSGGNQQKIVLSRWLATEPDLLIVDEPTVGVDVGARAEIYRILRRLADSGKAILMISSDVEEIINESDRILVMYKGRTAGEFEKTTDTHELMAAATGLISRS